MNEQLKELSTDSMLETMCPSLSMLAKICLTVPLGTVSVECSFSQMKMKKTRLRNCLGDTNLSHLMKIARHLEQEVKKNICLMLSSH